MSRPHSSRLLPVSITLAGLVLGISPAFAGDSSWFIEARLGQSDFDAVLGSRWPKHFGGDDDAFGIELGYSVNRYFAVQVGYHDFGEGQGTGAPCPEDAEICIATVDGQPLAIDASALAICIPGAPDLICGLVATPLVAEMTGVSLAAVPSWPVNDRFSIFGKVGLMAWDADVAEAFDGFPIDSLSDRDLLTGVGLRYTFPSGFGVAAEYQQFDLDVGATSLGASWRF